jgi:hypothetical protein
MSGRLDSNQRPPEPHSGALAKLRHAPSCHSTIGIRPLVAEDRLIVNQASARAYPLLPIQTYPHVRMWFLLRDIQTEANFRTSSEEWQISKAPLAFPANRSL